MKWLVYGPQYIANLQWRKIQHFRIEELGKFLHFYGTHWLFWHSGYLRYSAGNDLRDVHVDDITTEQRAAKGVLDAATKVVSFDLNSYALPSRLPNTTFVPPQSSETHLWWRRQNATWSMSAWGMCSSGLMIPPGIMPRGSPISKHGVILSLRGTIITWFRNPKIYDWSWFGRGESKTTIDGVIERATPR